MDKKDSKPPKKPMSKTPRETFSLDEESIQIINDEIADAERHGFEIRRSAVVRRALQLLKTHRESVKRTQINAQSSAKKAQKQGAKKIQDAGGE